MIIGCKFNNKNRSSLVFWAFLTKFHEKSSYSWLVKVFFVPLRLLIKMALKWKRITTRMKNCSLVKKSSR